MIADSLRITFGDSFDVQADDDGYPAVRVRNSAFVEEPRWITASGYHPDLEDNVRELAYALLEMADAMAAGRDREKALQ